MEYQEETRQPELKSERIFREAYEWVSQIAQVVIVVVLLFTFVARTSIVSGPSMLQTLQNDDMLVISRLFYTPKQGDIVVVTKPNHDNEPIVKRIIATEGQQVDIDFNEGVVYVDGMPLDEPYVNSPTNRSFDVQFPLTVPQGEVFVMGDNRNQSNDSRASEIGTIDERYLLGKAYWRLLPLKAFGGLYD